MIYINSNSVDGLYMCINPKNNPDKIIKMVSVLNILRNDKRYTNSSNKGAIKTTIKIVGKGFENKLFSTAC